MTQSKKGSALEAVVNVAVGFAINFAANALLFPLFGWHLSGEQNLGLGVIYTAISLVRSFTLRRIFNSQVVRTMRAAP
jgi:hypothetical protein